MIPPNSIPKVVIDEINPAAPPERCKSLIIELIANDKKSTSMFSNAKPEAVDDITSF